MTAHVDLPRPVMTKRLRYVGIAAFCAAAHNGIMIGGDLAGIGYPVMTLVSFLLLTPTAYALHARLTFAEPLSLPRLMLFASGMAIGLPLSLCIMAILCSALRLPVIVAAPIATVILFLWNYASAHLSILGRLRADP